VVKKREKVLIDFLRFGQEVVGGQFCSAFSENKEKNVLPLFSRLHKRRRKRALRSTSSILMKNK